MKTKLLIFLAVLLTASSVHAVNSLQLFINGATYDWSTQTWVIGGSGFDLYVVSANTAKSDVIVSLAMAPTDNPNDASVVFGGNPISQSSWVYGHAPLENDPDHWDGGNDDLQPHGVYPTWFTEVHTGAYGLGSPIGNVQPNSSGDYWNPATGSGDAPAWGQFKTFHVEASGVFSYLHFDAYTLNSDGTIDDFAPFSHDAQMVPEPGTIILMSGGLLGLGALRIKRRKQ